MTVLTKVSGKAAALAITAAAMALPSAAHSAQFIVDGTVDKKGIDYIFFTYTGGDISVSVRGLKSGPNIELINPYIRLMVDNGSPVGGLTGAFLAADDNSGPGLNAFLTTPPALPGGSYILAIGAFFMTENEARTGSASTPIFDSDYRAKFKTKSGDLTFNTGPIPEPSTWALMLLGFLGVGAAMRRRAAVRSVSVSYS